MSKNGKRKPGKNDARLLLQIYEAQATHKVDDALAYIWSNDFPAEFAAFREKFPGGSSSSQEKNVFRALTYYETIGTIYRNGLINEDLLFDWAAIDLTWDRLKNFVEGVRAEIGHPRMFENFEYMAGKSANWKPKR